MAAESWTTAYDDFSQRPDRRLDSASRRDRSASKACPCCSSSCRSVARPPRYPLTLAASHSGPERRPCSSRGAARQQMPRRSNQFVAGRRTDGPVDERCTGPRRGSSTTKQTPDRTRDGAPPRLAKPLERRYRRRYRRWSVRRLLDQHCTSLKEPTLSRSVASEDLVDLLVAAALAAPAMCALRSLWRITGSTDQRDPNVLAAAARIVGGFPFLAQRP